MDELGLNLLWEDKRFIEKCLAGQSEWLTREALKDYKLVWLEAANKEPAEHKKDNAGRRAANTFLREIICPSLSDNISSAA